MNIGGSDDRRHLMVDERGKTVNGTIAPELENIEWPLKGVKMKQRKEQAKKRMLYQAPYKSPIVLAIDTCSQSTCCTQSPSRATATLCFTNSQPPTVHQFRSTQRAPVKPMTSTPVKNVQNERYATELGESENMITSTPVDADQETNSPVIPFQNTNPVDKQEPQTSFTPKRQSSVLSAPTTPRTPTIRPKNFAVTKPCTTPNRQQRRPEVQHYLEANLPRTPKKATSLKGVIKTTKKTTPKKFNKIHPLSKSNVDHDLLRYHYLTKSPSAKSSPARTVASTASSRVFEFQSSPRRAIMFQTSGSAKEAAKQSVLLTIRKVAQELAKLRKRRQLLYIGKLIECEKGSTVSLALQRRQIPRKRFSVCVSGTLFNSFAQF
ncbi:hypothetical protein LOTGIDRAFT_159235 [Lottia gigantea]|uniref:Uncharacterized protein n=1 Tax=Lottia gigantea TaxID=225164 RepID=V4A3K0_LOTGI|nr:hypothetical protein LOTGIDRAFT_159235 [Lottia gigantea]ESO98428.1 hypothetical protein LOTGIDRAFT_159235 [Lottia gigantea]